MCRFFKNQTSFKRKKKTFVANQKVLFYSFDDKLLHKLNQRLFRLGDTATT